MIIQVFKNSMVPPVVPAGKRQSTGVPLEFQFTSDWDGMAKYVSFYTPKGQPIEVPYLGGEISIPPEIMQHGGITRFNVSGVSIDGETGVAEERLKVTGTISVSYNIGENPRLWGKATPSTLELLIDQTQKYIEAALQAAKDSGEFKGDTGDAAGFADPIATTETLDPQEDASVTITASGPNTGKTFTFSFKIPRGDSGVYVSNDVSDTPHGQNLWIVTDGGDSVIAVPDGIVKAADGKVYLMCEGDPIGAGVSINGQNFTILGNYATLAALQAAHPNPDPGDAYGVGASEPYDVYVYDGVSETWKNYGALGIAVDVSLDGTSTNPVQNKAVTAALDTLENAIPTELKNPYSLTLFGTSYDGSAAVTVNADDEMSDSSVKPVQNSVVKGYIDGLIGDVASAIEDIEEIIGGQT